VATKIDLHIHTTFSDGISSPKEILDMARWKKLKAIAICDHDNFAGYFAIKELRSDNDPEIIPGVELSAGKDGEDIHILGYLFDPQSTAFVNALQEFRDTRNKRGEMMLKRLKEMGMDVPIDLVKEIAGDSAIGRPTVADAMVQVGVIKSFDEAFANYIGLDGPAYVPKQNLSPQKAIELIHAAGGLAFLAHPAVAQAYNYIDEFIGYGLDGLEIHHPYHNSKMRKYLNNTAEERSLLRCGGSDYHGREKHHGKVGSQPVPGEWLDEMKKRQIHKSRGIN
jgi:predicted metal-dependent phosphoesterase TrpH